MRAARDGSTPARWLVVTSGITVIGLAVGWPGGSNPWPSILLPAVFCGVALALIGIGRIAIPTALGFFAGMMGLVVPS
jgi:hypothetical protein